MEYPERGIIGIYHFVSTEHLHRYTTEFSYRYNNQRSSGVEKFQLAISQSAKKRLSYNTLTGKDANPVWNLSETAKKNAAVYVEKGYEHLRRYRPGQLLV